MSIRRVNCPACKSVANVPATMTDIKCPSCGQVWNVNQPQAAAPTSTPASSDNRGNSNAAVFAGVAGAVVMLAILGISIALFLPGTEDTKPQDPVSNTASEEVEVAVVEGPPSYREVDLPESTRQKIYWDYRLMAKSSIEKKLMIPKDSPVRSSVEGMLQKTVDREIKHFSLLYNISEDDVMQIVAEGDAKQWPGSKKPEKSVPKE